MKFTAWLVPADAIMEGDPPIATFVGERSDDETWSGGYDAVWEVSQELAQDLAEELVDVAPGVREYRVSR